MGRLTLLDLVAESAPSDAHLIKVEAALDICRHLVQREFGGSYQLRMQGSYEQGLLLTKSDLDCVIIPPGDRMLSKQQQRDYLGDIVDTIQENPAKGLRIAQRIFHARVPIIRLQWKKLMLDISVGDNSRGTADTAIRRLIGSDTSGLAVVLCRLIKIWTKAHPFVCNTMNGGLSAFAFVLLTISFLQKHHLISSYNELEEDGSRCVEPPRSQAECEKMKLDPLIVLRKLSELFKFLVDVPIDVCQTVSVMSGRRRRVRSTGSILHVEVPFQNDEQNAARCLTKPRWIAIRKKLLQTHQALNAAVKKPKQDPGPTIRQVFNYRHQAPESSSEEEVSEEECEDSEEESEEDSEVEWGSEREIVVDTDGESVASSSEPEEEQVHHAARGIMALRAQLTGVKRAAPPPNSGRKARKR